ncbi:hypothetical protein [Arthrobacter livingstonensis]|uniref:hypothetical protein n=1 Tax=Arthrobacter livingstonensis TaxID=670078 RepID=UPI001FE2565F|nr:hypothetical protein [Arthrobacter livingstonensis]
MASVDVLTFGETMVSLRSEGPLAQGGNLAMHAAGAESNVAVGLSRLGHSVRAGPAVLGGTRTANSSNGSCGPRAWTSVWKGTVGGPPG